MGKKQGWHNCADKRQLKQRHAKKTRRLPKHGLALAGAQKGGTFADRSQLKQRHAKKTRRLPKHGRAMAGAQKGGCAFCYFSERPYSS